MTVKEFIEQNFNEIEKNTVMSENSFLGKIIDSDKFEDMISNHIENLTIQEYIEYRKIIRLVDIQSALFEILDKT